jgi:hypothetical protein
MARLESECRWASFTLSRLHEEQSLRACRSTLLQSDRQSWCKNKDANIQTEDVAAAASRVAVSAYLKTTSPFRIEKRRTASATGLVTNCQMLSTILG